MNTDETQMVFQADRESLFHLCSSVFICGSKLFWYSNHMKRIGPAVVLFKR